MLDHVRKLAEAGFGAGLKFGYPLSETDGISFGLVAENVRLGNRAIDDAAVALCSDIWLICSTLWAICVLAAGLNG